MNHLLTTRELRQHIAEQAPGAVHTIAKTFGMAPGPFPVAVEVGAITTSQVIINLVNLFNQTQRHEQNP